MNRYYALLVAQTALADMHGSVTDEEHEAEVAKCSCERGQSWRWLQEISEEPEYGPLP